MDISVRHSCYRMLMHRVCDYSPFVGICPQRNSRGSRALCQNGHRGVPAVLRVITEATDQGSNMLLTAPKTLFGLKLVHRGKFYYTMLSPCSHFPLKIHHRCHCFLGARQFEYRPFHHFRSEDSFPCELQLEFQCWLSHDERHSRVLGDSSCSSFAGTTRS